MRLPWMMAWRPLAPYKPGTIGSGIIDM